MLVSYKLLHMLTVAIRSLGAAVLGSILWSGMVGGQSHNGSGTFRMASQPRLCQVRSDLTWRYASTLKRDALQIRVNAYDLEKILQGIIEGPSIVLCGASLWTPSLCESKRLDWIVLHSGSSVGMTVGIHIEDGFVGRGSTRQNANTRSRQSPSRTRNCHCRIRRTNRCVCDRRCELGRRNGCPSR